MRDRRGRRWEGCRLCKVSSGKISRDAGAVFPKWTAALFSCPWGRRLTTGGEFAIYHIASCSFGKDSLATILLALEHGEPLDEAIYCEVMFDAATSGEIPEHRDFIREKGIPFLDAHGVKVTVLRSSMTYLDSFYRVIQRGVAAGKLNSWPLCGRCCIQRDCKLPPITAYQNTLGPDTVQYIGYACDEQERLLRLDGGRQVSLLAKYRVSEADAAALCKRAGLYSPIYEFTSRNGCFFCPNSALKELRHLYDHHPDLWAKLLALQKTPNKATERFNRSHRIDEIDMSFQWEDRQCSLFDPANYT